MSKPQVYDWYQMVKEGRELVDDEPHDRRPRTSTDGEHVNEIKELVLKNRRLTIIDLVDTTQISFGSIQSILKGQLGLRRVSSRLVRASTSKIVSVTRRNVVKVLFRMGTMLKAMK